MREIRREYPTIDFYDELDLTENMKEIYAETNEPFIIIIDEWDCIFREYAEDKGLRNEIWIFFVIFPQRRQAHIHLAYMTGILPIKKYGTHSALNMFDEFSLSMWIQVFWRNMSVSQKMRCAASAQIIKWIWQKSKNGMMDIALKKPLHLQSAFLVVAAMTSGICGDSYWNQTETFEALRGYIDMNFDGLKDDVLSMMAGEMVPVNTGSFSNDMTTFHSEDDVLTLLIHLGYLGYDFSHKSVFIPNNEIRGEFVNAVSVSQWGEVSKALKNSADLLNAIWRKDEESSCLYGTGSF